MACYDRSTLTRRQVLGRGVGLGLTLYASKLMTIDRVLEAAQAQDVPDAPVLVSVFLPGGCDLLAALPPLDQLGRLHDLRASLPPGDVPALPGERSLGIHPALADGTNGGIAGLFGAGKIGFLPGLDYADPDLSHFHSRHFWERGIVTPDAGSGWLGRWLDQHGNGDNPLQGLSMDTTLSPLLRAGFAPAAAVSDTRSAALNLAGTSGDLAVRATATWEQLAAAPRVGAGPAAAGRAAALSLQVGQILAPYAADPKAGSDPLAGSIAYPGTTFAGRLRSLAGLIAQPLGIRVATISAPGDFDTHDNEAAELDDALRQLSQGLSAFQADLEARGVADRVLTFVWSEFGRRPSSNNSGGTDHGAGGIGWVQGTRVRGGVLSDVPDLGALDAHGNLAVTVDFRRVYASLLEGWMGTDAAEVLPGAAAFGRLALVQ
jgi:uncharacterized protein (DUF1501 family)